jgi:hypothetical protein
MKKSDFFGRLSTTVWLIGIGLLVVLGILTFFDIITRDVPWKDISILSGLTGLILYFISLILDVWDK